MKKTSLADLANSLGVSKTLVSMVLNDRGDEHGISASTQQKVREKAKELNYKPNQVARGLRTGKSNTIGIIVADISNRFYARISRSAEEKARKLGYNVMFCSSDEDPEKEAELIEMFRDRQTDGLIISTTQSNQLQISQLKKEGYPFVLIDRHIPKLETNYVGVDNYSGAHNAVTHLLNSGYDRIALLTISPAHITPIRERGNGYKDALNDKGISPQPELIREIPFDNITESVDRQLKELISAPIKANALFVANNSIAAACIDTINRMNLRIPEDIALVSFDDIEMFKFSYPSVTAVAQPIEDIGTNAVDLLINALENGHTSPSYQQVVLPVNLVVRKSCGSNPGA